MHLEMKKSCKSTFVSKRDRKATINRYCDIADTQNLITEEIEMLLDGLRLIRGEVCICMLTASKEKSKSTTPNRK